ncbi:hypothetical protein [Pseudalkalibacillus caeni]|uniref:Uncharacterized protein n=1 Tax=Exobacillus caeni TaxID=2574798 RepID=A0A5R9F4Y9_9BACL|nr:hypothetical protein [Pseudalkalibacillus caeni]TLS37460.1 hypothetical protein FCL54_09955 [Pseudalkalibacillus caeni]
MNKRRGITSKTDPIQLQQKIIYFKAELAKYKEKVKDYQENFHYNQLENLKSENISLIEKQEELEEKLAEEKETNNNYKQKASELQTLTSRQEKELGKLKSLVTEIQKANQSYMKELENEKTVQKQLNQKFRRISEENNHFNEQFKKQEQDIIALNEEIDGYKEKLLSVEKLQKQVHSLKKENQELKQTYKGLITDIGSLKTIDSESETPLLIQLQEKIKQLASQTSEYEEKLQDRFATMEVLEGNTYKLKQEMAELKTRFEDSKDH